MWALGLGLGQLRSQEQRCASASGTDGKYQIVESEAYGSFPKSGDPNIDPKILESLLLGPPKRDP